MIRVSNAWEDRRLNDVCLWLLVCAGAVAGMQGHALARELSGLYPPHPGPFPRGYVAHAAEAVSGGEGAGGGGTLLRGLVGHVAEAQGHALARELSGLYPPHPGPLPHGYVAHAARAVSEGKGAGRGEAAENYFDQCLPVSAAARLPRLQSATTISSLDGEEQPLLYWVPEAASERPVPLFVFLHSWSGDYRQDNSKWLSQAVQREWIYLHPNFRGANKSPKACGSRFARQDILDAMEFICRRYRVDPQRVYLAGVSGGGHMSMLMAGWHPDRFSAVSAWVGVSDLADWHQFHTKDGKPQNYAKMIQQSLLGAPGASPEIDAQYRERSPVHHLHRAVELPIGLYAGVNDGHSGSVPVSHSLRAFNVLARASGQPQITDEEMQQLLTKKQLARPRPSDTQADDDFGRDTLLRRTAGRAHVVIFDGGHESLPEPACDWLEQQQRRVPIPTAVQ